MPSELMLMLALAIGYRAIRLAGSVASARSWIGGLGGAALAALAGCTGEPTTDGPFDTGSETDTDTGSETDTDSDSDSDSTERCDGIDNDGDGLIDEDDAEDAATWYGDVDGDGFGDAAITTTACTQPTGYVDVSGDCDDADASVYSGADEICDDGVVNDCEGDEADAMSACMLGGTVSAADVDLMITGEAEDDRAGREIAAAGDVDGDGRGDLLIGAYEEGTGGKRAGAAYLVLSGGALASGSSTLSLAEADLKLVGEAREAYAGVSVSGAGDVDGDGRDDLLVGAYGDDTGGAGAGAAYLLLSGALGSGSTTLDLSEADLKLTGSAVGDLAGFAVAGTGDVDGDGLGDVVVGASNEHSVGAYGGAVYLLLSGGELSAGSSALDLVNSDHKLLAEAGGDRVGSSLSGLGDVDGDGRDELLVGAPHESSGGGYAGAAYLLLSGGALASPLPLFPLSASDLKLIGESGNDYAGASVAGAGDVDGDGRDDLLVGATSEDAGGSSAGATYLLLSDGALSSGSSVLALSEGDLKLIGEAANDSSGGSTSGAGDMSGDGRDDLLIGAYGEDTGGASAGAAYLLLSDGALAGAAGTLSLASADLKIIGESGDNVLGYSVAGPGDVNGDGRCDLFVGAWGQDAAGDGAGAAYLIYGTGY